MKTKHTHIRAGKAILCIGTDTTQKFNSINAAKKESRLHQAPGVKDRWTVRTAESLARESL